MAIIFTRFRDIPYAELRELHPNGIVSEEYWESLRGTPVQIVTPPLDPDVIHPTPHCGGPFYDELLPDRGTFTRSVTCIHEVEIGD